MIKIYNFIHFHKLIKQINFYLIYFIFLIVKLFNKKNHGDWGLGIGPNPQSPIPNPQSPIPNPHYGNKYKYFLFKIFFKNNDKTYNKIK